MKDSKFTAMPLPPVPSLDEQIRNIVREEIAALGERPVSLGINVDVASSVVKAIGEKPSHDKLQAIQA